MKAIVDIMIYATYSVDMHPLNLLQQESAQKKLLGWPMMLKMDIEYNMIKLLKK